MRDVRASCSRTAPVPRRGGSPVTPAAAAQWLGEDGQAVPAARPPRQAEVSGRTLRQLR
jgi:hypothetical protein